jgi:hypothetical protein
MAAFDSGLYDHFNQRLQERYGLSCTIEEWKRISFYKLDNHYFTHNDGKGARNRTEGGTIQFKNKVVHIIRRFRTGLPVTALPPIPIEKIRKPKKKMDFKLIR